jgi:hypothetical protein
MEEPSSRDMKLAQVMEEFEGTVYHKALLEVVEESEFQIFQGMVSCNPEDLPLMQAKLRAYREFLMMIKGPQMKIDQYKRIMEQHRLAQETQYVR